MTDKPNEPMLPERVWAYMVFSTSRTLRRMEWTDAPKDHAIEYIRADKYDKLREALEKAEKHLAEYITCDPMLRGGRSEKLLEEVREALKGNE